MVRNILLILLCISSATIAQNVNIPDADFKNCLLSNPDININGDGEIQVSEAQDFTGYLDCANLDINDPTGIEEFIAATIIRLSFNPIGDIDLTNNIGLDIFLCEDCDLNSINLDGLTTFNFLNISSNNLVSIDASGLPDLREIIALDNPFTSVTFNNPLLERVRISNATFTTIDVSNAPFLDDLWVNNTPITQIDLSSNVNLEVLQLNGTNLTNIDLSNNLSLQELRCNGTQNLISLDLSTNTLLENLFLIDSPTLSELKVASGFNSNIATLFALDCEALSCIEVDTTIDIVNPPAGWNVDSEIALSYDCPDVIVFIPDANFKACLLANTGLNSNGDTEIQISEALLFEGSIICDNMGIETTEGIEAFSNLSLLRLNNNIITVMDISSNLMLVDISVTGNPLTALSTLNNDMLTRINIIGTDIQTVDLSNNPQLDRFVAQTSQLNSIDFSENPLLRIFNVRATNINSLDVSMLPLLETLSCSDNSIISLDTSNNPALEYLTCDGNAIENIDLSANPMLIEVFVDANALETLILANGNNNLITSFDAINNPNLLCIEVDEDIDLNNPPNAWEKDDTAVYSYDCLSLGNQEFSVNNISIFPNPTNDVITITSEMPIKEVMLYNVQGALMTEGNINIISLGNFPSGVYFLKIKSNTNSVVTKRIIKK